MVLKPQKNMLKISSGAIFLLMALMLTSCFTGIEGTKKITLSKTDLTRLEPEPEEKVLENVVSEKLGVWRTGKKFFITDDKIMYVVQGNSPTPPAYGTILTFEGTERKVTPSGVENTYIVFETEGAELKYQIRKPLEEARENFISVQLPMLIDMDMVDKASTTLSGNSYWIKTGLWYDESEAYKSGKKFSKIKVSSVEPGNTTFPLRVNFTDENGEEAHVLINFGNSGNESRSFAHLFSLKDIRQRYPGITDEIWALIQQSQVRNGMTKEECKLALGNPSDVNQGHDYSRTLEMWQYPDGAYLQFADGILVNFRR